MSRFFYVYGVILFMKKAWRTFSHLCRRRDSITKNKSNGSGGRLLRFLMMFMKTEAK